MSRKLQVSLVRRKRTFTQRNSTGRQEKTSDEMIPEFELEQITRHGGLLDQATYKLAGLDFTYKTPTRAQDGRREAGTPMALALEKRLKRLQEPLTIEQVKAFLNNQMKDNIAAHECFKTYLNSKFKEKQRDRLATFLRTFP